MIELSQIVKRYKTRSGTHTVLDGVDLTVRMGDKAAKAEELSDNEVIGVMIEGRDARRR